MEENKENIVAGVIVLGTITIYHILLFGVGIFRERGGILGGIGIGFWTGVLIPGGISAILFYLLSKKPKKAIITGVITSIAWALWFAIYLAMTFRVH